MPDNNELGRAVVGSDTEAVDAYDSKYGKYEDNQGKNTASGPKPANQPSPISGGGSSSE